jgi:hypothetical protein
MRIVLILGFGGANRRDRETFYMVKFQNRNIHRLAVPKQLRFVDNASRLH